MKLDKINFLITNNHSVKQSQSNTINFEQKYKNEYSKYSIDNLKANYIVNFKGNVTVEDSPTNSIGILNQETHFFREPQTDELVQIYVLNNFWEDPEINIVSGACATGEETKSYAMMLDSLGDKLHLSGFDISANVIRQANNDTVRLLIETDAPNNNGVLDSEKFITNDDCNLTPYLRKCKEKFITYYNKSGNPYKEPVFPDKQKELDDLKSILKDKEKYEKTKKEYYEQLQTIKEQFANQGLGDFEFLYNQPSFEESIEMSIKTIEQQCEMYHTFQDFTAKEKCFDNCHFKQGDILNLKGLYKPNSINVLLYKNALYHTLCEGNNIYRIMREDAQEKMDDIAKQMNQVVKPSGLVVFGEREMYQGIDSFIIENSMTKYGFKKLINNGEECDNIWVKFSSF